MDELIAESELGEQAREFLESELGRCLVGMAEQDAKAAQEALTIVDPSDVSAIRALQNKATLAVQFKQYLAELVDRGNAAITVFRQQLEE